MGGCVHKGNEVITIRIKEQNQNPVEYSKNRNKKYMSTAISSLDNHSQKYNKNKIPFPSLYSNDISKILEIPELMNNDSNFNNFSSFREIIELFEYKKDKKNFKN